ncbi:ATP-dependent DNA helicase [Trichonephila clavipes]|uniref:ATP-dependent DNA helicase n=1 Tax=Trichonephila clavipes TaxID=2585209 RepID=A0A8X6RWT4_TRICX|nr:ATP-dependent DNA helicase [Trichonephila clavipes]
MLRSSINIEQGLVNGAMGFIIEIVWPSFSCDQIYDTDILSVRIDFSKDGIHLIKSKSIQFSVLRNYETIERTQLPLILCWACTVHKMQGYSVDHAVVYLGPALLQATILDRVLGARAAGVHYRLFSVWTLVPVRLGKQLSDHSTVDEIASGAADCRLTYTMANCPQRRGKKRKKGGRTRKIELEKTRAGRFRKRRGESQSFLFRDADQESKTRMRNNALCGLDRDKLWSERLQNGATILARHGNY